MTGYAALRGLPSGHPTLSLKLSTAGCLPPTQSLTINLPHGLTFSHNTRTLRRARHVTPAGRSGFILKKRSLTIYFLTKPRASIGLTINAPAMIESNALRHQARTGHQTLTIVLGVHDNAGTTSRLVLRYRRGKAPHRGHPPTDRS